MTTDVQNLEKRLARLDAIVAQLEREDLELDQALALFEEGVGHLRASEQAIGAAELRIQRLLEGPGGEPALAAMPVPVAPAP